MNIKALWGVIALVVIIGGGWYVATLPSDDAMIKEEGDAMVKDEGDVMTKKEDEAMKKEETGAMMQKGSYVPYEAEKLAMANSGDVVLFFRASWCPTCRALDANIRANLSAIPSSLTILDVNYDAATALKQKYGVTYQHTLVQVDASGNMITKWTGSPTLAALIAQVK